MRTQHFFSAGRRPADAAKIPFGILWPAHPAHVTLPSVKTPIPIFAAGCAAGALIMWFVKPAPELESGRTVQENSPSALAATRVSNELAKQTARVEALEKEVKALKSGMEGIPASLSSSLPVPALSPLEQKQMEELERKQDEKDVNREVDRLSLRLNLTGDQQAALRNFMARGKESQREAIKAVAKGGFPKFPSPEESLTEEEFLAKLLTAEQQSEYARAKEEQRRTRAEDFAQRKVRKLDNELNLTEQQKDVLFQACAQLKLEASDPVRKAEAAANFPGVEMVLVAGEIDHKVMEAILTPEQLAVYDQRLKDENEQSGAIIRQENGFTIEDLPVPLPTGDEEEDEEMDDEEAADPK